jgi:acetyl-CoA synthetase (ADP-forming)
MPTLSEAESKQLLSRHGVPVPAEAVVATPEEAAAAAADIGFPVVVKLCGAAIAHKTERGLVKLGLRDPAAVAAAAGELLAAARPDDGDVGLLVGAMVAGARELIAGFVRDDEFGPCVMLGVGGVLAEAVGDVGFRLVPLQPVDAEDLIDELSNQALLGPVRGEPAVDRAALAGILLGLAAVGDGDERIRSIDLNPLIVSDGIPVAVDALVEVDR